MDDATVNGEPLVGVLAFGKLDGEPQVAGSLNQGDRQTGTWHRCLIPVLLPHTCVAGTASCLQEHPCVA